LILAVIADLHPKNKEYNEITGLGGWGGRNENSGPYIRWREGEIVRDMTPGPGGNHGPAHPFEIVVRDKKHPITAGLPETWVHAKDELYHGLRGPAENMTVLATAYSSPDFKGTGEHEPILFTISYGKGRVFQTTLGHAGGDKAPVAMQCAGFIVTLQRGAEWAATGNVTQGVPRDFPDAVHERLRRAFKAPDLDALLDAIKPYQYGQSLSAMVEIDDYVSIARANSEEMLPIERKFDLFLKSDATLPAKQYICKKLAEMGSDLSMPLLAGMLADDATMEMARFALEGIPDEAVSRRLRELLPGSAGNLRIGIIDTLGARKDRDAVPVLAEQAKDANPDVAMAAVTALGRVADRQSAEALARIAGESKDALHEVAVDARLRCADAELAGKNRKSAADVYASVYRSPESAPLRKAALEGLVNASGDGAGAIIVEAIKGDDTAMQSAAIALVRRVPGTAAVKAVAAELATLAPVAQVQLTAALADRGDAAALGAVTNLLDSQDAAVRGAAVKALAALGNGSSVAALAVRAAANQEESKAAAEALARLRAKDVDAAIIAQLGAASDPGLSVALLEALAARKVKAAKDAVLPLASTGDAAVRAAAHKTLRVVAEPDALPALVEVLLKAPDDAAREEAGTTLAEVAKKSADSAVRTKAVLEALAAEQTPEAKAALLAALGKIGDDAGLPVLRDALKEANTMLRNAAIKGLSAWPTSAPMGDLFELAKQIPSEPDGALALDGYVRLLGLSSDRSAEETVKLLQEALPFASAAAEKEAVISGLGATKHASALPVLYAALSGSDETVATAALKTLCDWPDDAPLESVVKVARESRNPTDAALALRGYVRLVGVNANRPPDQAATMYDEAMNLAKTPDDKKMVLSGLATTSNIAALRISARALDDAALKAEAEVAVVKIAKAVAGMYPDEVRELVNKVAQGQPSEYAEKMANKVLSYLDKFAGFVVAWQYCGPFTQDGANEQKLFDIAFPPETPDADKCDWKVLPAGLDKKRAYVMALDKLMEGNNRVAYARTKVFSPVAQDAVLQLGSDDGARVWLNGAEVLAKNATRAMRENEDQVKLPLQQGWNALLLKITQGGGQWEFCVRIRTADDRTVEGMKVDIAGQ
jgi:HEAT repeat protein